MPRFQEILLAVTLCAGLSACVTPTPPVEVTRFHNATPEAPLARGTVKILPPVVPENGPVARIGALTPLEHGTFAAAVMRELQRVGYSDSAVGPAQFEAVLSVERTRMSAGGERSPVSVGVGGGTGSYGSGVGVGIGINLSGAPKDIIVTQLSVRINDVKTGVSVWEGRASVQAKDGAPATQPGLAASKLAQSLFQDFPGVSGSTIEVP